MDTPDPVTTPAADPALCPCGKDALGCSRTNCSVKLQKVQEASTATTTPETPATPSTATASDPTASLASILAGIDPAKLPAIVDMFQRLGATPAGDPIRATTDEGGGAVKADAGKPSITLVPSSAILGMASVLTFGAKKYSRDNWRKGMNYTRILDAGLRHIMAVVDGEDLDEETGLPHVYHAMCCLAFLGEYQGKGSGNDDRYKEVSA